MEGSREKRHSSSGRIEARLRLISLIDKAERLRRMHPDDPCLPEVLGAIEKRAMTCLRAIMRQD